MNKIFLAVAVTFFVATVSAQKVARVHLTQTGDVEMIGLALEQNIILNISQDGNVVNFGIDHYALAGRGTAEMTPGRLDPFEGRLVYYSEAENAAFRGKVKFISGTLISYYGDYDNAALIGKVKSIGPTKFEYYIDVANEAYRGKLKRAGQTIFKWFNTFDNDAFVGKPEAIGTTHFLYYTNTDDEAYRGKIKMIGPSRYEWYSNHELEKSWRGRMKTGQQNPTINGVRYYIKY